MAENRVIGRDCTLPWRLSDDMKRFKALTIGKPIVMGRKTWDSLGRLLPDRVHVVISRDPAFAAPGVSVAHSLEDALRLAKKAAEASGAEEICIIGGGEIYAQALPVADRLYVTHVGAEIDGDTFFPKIDPSRWREVASESRPADDRNSHPTRFVEYRRAAD